MYNFEKLSIGDVNVDEYENSFDNKNLFCTVEWLSFLSVFRKVTPIVIRITDNKKFVGYFSGAFFSKFGFKILGSPFYGWMGLHMGFEFVNLPENCYSELIDEFVSFVKRELRITYFVFADFKINREILHKCKQEFFIETDARSYFLDISKSEEELFKNLKSGYRTCVRKFEKLGGRIVEDYSDEFIEEHNKQLKDVFERKSLSAPDYSKRMKILRDNYRSMVLFIKALDENGRNIASSYYLGGGKTAFFASNASYTDSLKYNANQALMWFAIKYWKNKGMTTMDLAGTGDYKANYGSELFETPIVVCARYKWEYVLIQKLRYIYYQRFRVKHKIIEFLHSPKKGNNTNEKRKES